MFIAKHQKSHHWKLVREWEWVVDPAMDPKRFWIIIIFTALCQDSEHENRVLFPLVTFS